MSRTDRGSVPEDLVREHRGLGSTLEAELGQQAGHVTLHRLLGQEHLGADLPVGQALRDEFEDAPFLGCQRREFLRFPGVAGADAVEHPLHDGRIEHAAAGGTVRIASRSVPLICLRRYPEAPDMITLKERLVVLTSGPPSPGRASFEGREGAGLAVRLRSLRALWR